MPINNSNFQGRQPSPAAPQQAAPSQINGSATGVLGHGGGGGGGGGSFGVVQTGVAHAGHQTDMNYLWSMVEELSAVLAQNRSQTEGIITGVQRLQHRAREGEELSLQRVNGETSSQGSATAVEVAELQAKLHQATRERDAYVGEVHQYASILDNYEATLNGLMDKVRVYAAEHTDATIAVHKHYNGLLEQERDANLNLRLEHGEWQARLAKANEWARQALRAANEEERPLLVHNRELKAENRVLRALVGWEVESDSDGDGDERDLPEIDSKGRPAEPGVSVPSL